MKTHFPPSPLLLRLLASAMLMAPLPQALASGAGADSFSNATVLTYDDDFSVQTDHFNMTAQLGEPSHRDDQYPSGGKSAWWRWTAPENGYFTADTLENYRYAEPAYTTLSIYTGSTVSQLTRICSNDNFFAPGVPIGNYSCATCYVVKGTTYYIAVDGENAGANNITAQHRYTRLHNSFMPLRRAVKNGVINIYGSQLPLGSLTLAQTDKGTFTGKLNLDGKVTPIAGAFDSGGTCTLAIPQKTTPPRPPITLKIFGKPTGGFQIILPHLNNEDVQGTLREKLTFTAARPNPTVGRINGILEYTLTSYTPGILSMNIAPSGTVTGVATLVDGTATTFGSSLHGDMASTYRSFPFYKSLAGGKGGFTVLGGIFEGGNLDSLTGECIYRRPPATAPGAVFYPAGFSTRYNLVGTTYPKPTPRQRPQAFLNASAGAGTFRATNAGTELATATLIENITLTQASKITFRQPTVSGKPALTLNPATGLVTGSFTAPGAGQKKRTVKGILYNNLGQWRVRGFATGSTQNLPVQITP